jgi:hypothetical protein
MQQEQQQVLTKHLEEANRALQNIHCEKYDIMDQHADVLDVLAP